MESEFIEMARKTVGERLIEFSSVKDQKNDTAKLRKCRDALSVLRERYVIFLEERGLCKHEDDLEITKLCIRKVAEYDRIISEVNRLANEREFE